jgi:tRNA (guanine-N7-)-methyltransferase
LSSNFVIIIIVGSKNKLKRFKENETFSNVFQPTREEMMGNHPMKGKWGQEVFKNNHPLILELGWEGGIYGRIRKAISR